MIPSAFIQNLSDCGISLSLDPFQNIKYDSLNRDLPDDIKQEIRTHKPQLVSYLSKLIKKDHNSVGVSSHTPSFFPVLAVLPSKTAVYKASDGEICRPLSVHKDGICRPENDNDLWQSAFCTLLARPKPLNIKEERWDLIKGWCEAMNKEEVTSKLSSYGWQFKDIFGCHATNPEEANSQQGFLLNVTSPWNAKNEGLTILDFMDDRIVLLQDDGYYRNYFKQSQVIPNQSILLEVI